jgi:hypothetical protein
MTAEALTMFYMFLSISIPRFFESLVGPGCKCYNIHGSGELWRMMGNPPLLEFVSPFKWVSADGRKNEDLIPI